MSNKLCKKNLIPLYNHICKIQMSDKILEVKVFKAISMANICKTALKETKEAQLLKTILQVKILRLKIEIKIFPQLVHDLSRKIKEITPNKYKYKLETRQNTMFPIIKILKEEKITTVKIIQ